MKTNTALLAWLYYMSSIIIPSAADAHGLAEDRLHALDHIIAHSPANPEGYVKRGQIYHDSEQWEKAINDYTTARQLDPEQHEALYWQGKALMQKGDYHIAQKTLLEYLLHQPYSPAGHRFIGKVYAQQQDYLSAAKHYDLAIEYDQNSSPQVYLERANILLNINPVPTQRIKSGLLEAIQKQGKIITYLNLLIELNINTKNYQEAEQWLTKLPDNLKNSPHWRNKKAALKSLQGHHNEALRLYTQNIDKIARLPLHKQNLPAFKATRKQAEQAIEQINQL